MIGRRLLLIVFALLILWLAFRQELVKYWDRNTAALDTLHSLVTNDPTRLHQAEQALLSLHQDQNCQGAWFLGLVYNVQGDLASRDQSWKDAIHCSRRYIPLTRVKEPEDVSLAEYAVQAHPEQAEAYFWLAAIKAKTAPEQAIDDYWQGLKRQPYDGNAWVQLGILLRSLDIDTALKIYEQLEMNQIPRNDPVLRAEPKFIMASILSSSKPEQAIQLYREGLTAKPADGVRWNELGDLLVKSDPQAAIEAYLQACYHGDPGEHGCYEAGKLAEEQGDILSAIRYYRLSDWDMALQRANELKQSLP